MATAKYKADGNMIAQPPADTMSMPGHDGVLKEVGPKLVPFIQAVVVYFAVLPQDDGPSWTGALVKVLPVLSLVLFVLLHKGSRLEDQCSDGRSFSTRVMLALSLSALADALLVWPAHFLHGMGVFGAAHLLYIAAFGFRPLRPALGVALYALSAWAVSFLVPGLKGPLLLGVPLYTAILVTMLWRAVAHQQEPAWSTKWFTLCPCVGGLLFTVSDLLIGLHMFYVPIPHSQVLIMTTYYAAQLGMALSVVSRPKSRTTSRLK